MIPPSEPARHSETATVNPQLQYLVKAMDASPAVLAKMYLSAAKDDTTSGHLHRALIRSMPGYSGHDASTTSELRKLQSARDPQVATVAKLRLAEMRKAAQCQKKLREIVVIERRTSAGARDQHP